MAVYWDTSAMGFLALCKALSTGLASTKDCEEKLVLFKKRNLQIINLRPCKHGREIFFEKNIPILK